MVSMVALVLADPAKSSVDASANSCCKSSLRRGVVSFSCAAMKE